VLAPDWRMRHSSANLAIGEVARLAGASRGQVRAATATPIRNGEYELPSFVTDGGTRVFAPQQVEKWLAGPGRRYALLTSQASCSARPRKTLAAMPGS
jgi:hypothetical protein